MKKNIALFWRQRSFLPTVIAAAAVAQTPGVSSSAEATAENPRL